MRCVRSMAMAVVGCLVSVAATSAMAQTVRYSVQGRFNGGAFATNATLNVGGGGNTASIVYNGLTDVAVDIDPDEGFTFASLGQFVTSAAGTGAALPAGTTFDLRIVQTDPGAGSADLATTASGKVRPTSSTVSVDFTSTSAVIGAATYVVLSDPLALVAPNSNGGVSTIQARLIAVPEPTSLGLMGVAAAGLLARRRRIA